MPIVDICMEIGATDETEALTTSGCPVYLPLLSDWGCMS